MTEETAQAIAARADLKTGDVFEIVYPFARATYSRFDGDEDGCGTTEVETWKPGVRHADKGEGDIESLADGFGRMVLTVVSVHKPGRFPTRVFFTRTWVTPDGKPFGKTKCRVTTRAAFRTLAQGYRHAFVFAGCQCAGCDWPYYDHRIALRVAALAAQGKEQP
jgi:hypothetical protein